jgi:hypothetical protein
VRTRLVGVAAAVVLLEAVACASFGSSGRRLRTFVDLVTVDAIVLALAGAFLVVDRPFLAARALVLRGDKRRDPAERRRLRALGWFVLLLGGLLYGTAALLWAAQGGTDAIDG